MISVTDELIMNKVKELDYAVDTPIPGVDIKDEDFSTLVKLVRERIEAYNKRINKEEALKDLEGCQETIVALFYEKIEHAKQSVLSLNLPATVTNKLLEDKIAKFRTNGYKDFVLMYAETVTLLLIFDEEKNLILTKRNKLL